MKISQLSAVLFANGVAAVTVMTPPDLKSLTKLYSNPVEPTATDDQTTTTSHALFTILPVSSDFGKPPFSGSNTGSTVTDTAFASSNSAAAPTDTAVTTTKSESNAVSTASSDTGGETTPTGTEPQTTTDATAAASSSSTAAAAFAIPQTGGLVAGIFAALGLVAL